MTATNPPRSVSEFLRRILDHGNDVAPVTAFYGSGSATQEQQDNAYEYARQLRDQEGVIEATISPGWGPGGDLLRVRVTEAGREYLIRHED